MEHLTADVRTATNAPSPDCTFNAVSAATFLDRSLSRAWNKLATP